MSCLTCSNCGFTNLLPPDEPYRQKTLNAIQRSDDIISQVLRGTRPLLDTDRAFIDAEIAKLEQLRSSYDAQLQEIQTRKDPVSKALENRMSIYAPVRRLPRDILIEIFHSVCDYRKCLTQQYHSLNVSGPLWVLGRVCGLWRHVLHTSPVSWARDLRVINPFSKNACEILRTYLKHTCEHPLRMNVSISRYKNGETENDEIMALLVQSHHRWKDVHLRISSSHAHHLQAISRPFSALQTIEVAINDGSTRDAACPDFRLDMTLNAPQLWQATLPRQGIFQVRLPPTITHYSGFITRAEDLQLLSQLPNLNTCHLSFTLIKSDSFKGPVVMAQLCRLYIGQLDIVNYLTAPVLKHLTLAKDPSYDSNDDPECIDLFLHRSGCHLESLSAVEYLARGQSFDSFTDLLSSEACSTISHFRSKLDLYDLRPILAFSDVLPNLRHLVLCLLMPAPHLEWEDLLPAIRSRHDPGVLKTIELQFETDRELEMEAEEEESYPLSEDEIKEDISAINAITGDNLEMWVAKWKSPDWEHLDVFTR